MSIFKRFNQKSKSPPQPPPHHLLQSASVNHDSSLKEDNNYSKNRTYSTGDIHETVKLQEQMLKSLKEETSAKKRQIETLKIELDKLKQNINFKFQTSSYDLEALKTEITDLTNKKAKLELKIREKSGWKCKKCTYQNVEQNMRCKICNAEREDDACWNCPYCQAKNLPTSLYCTNNTCGYDVGPNIDWPDN